MKMRISTMLALLCAGCLCAAPSFAANKALSVVGSGGTGTIVGGQGETVAIDIKVDDASMVAGASFTVTFDTDNLTLSSVTSTFFDTFTNQGIDPATVTVGSTTYDRPLVNNPTATGCMLAGARVTNGTGTNVTLFTLNFQLNGASGSYPITVVQSTIANTSAGYSATGEQIPALVGVDTASYPTHTFTVTPATLTIGNVDTDNDGIADSWEMAQFGNLTTANATSDYDRDGYSDLQEFLNWQNSLTDPLGAAYDPKTANAPGGEGYDSATDRSAAYDFNGDGTSDILVHKTSNGYLYIYSVVNSAIASYKKIATIPAEWAFEGIGDFNGDDTPDILVRNTTNGYLYVYTITNSAITSFRKIGTFPTQWTFEGIGDFNGDGTSDILARNTTNGYLYVYTITNSAITSFKKIATFPIQWAFEGIGDFNGDDTPDILARNTTNGYVYVYAIANSAIASYKKIATFPTEWTFEGIGDFNGEGTFDILARNTTNGYVYVYAITNSTIASVKKIGTFPNLWTFEGIGDYNGDRTSDILARNTNNGDLYIYTILNSAISSYKRIATFPADWTFE